MEALWTITPSSSSLRYIPEALLHPASGLEAELAIFRASDLEICTGRSSSHLQLSSKCPSIEIHRLIPDSIQYFRQICFKFTKMSAFNRSWQTRNSGSKRAIDENRRTSRDPCLCHRSAPSRRKKTHFFFPLEALPLTVRTASFIRREEATLLTLGRDTLNFTVLDSGMFI
jgi:hypothetical protein